MSLTLANKLSKNLDYQKTKDFDILEGYKNTQRKLIPTRGSSLANAQTFKEYSSEISHRVSALGPQRGGAIYLGDDGLPLKNVTFYAPELGKMVSSDVNGKVIYSNKGIVDEALVFYKEQQSMIDDAMEKVKINDEMCAYLLGYNGKAELRELLGGGKSFQVNGEDITEELAKANGMPDSIRLIPPKTQAQYTAVAKLRLLVGERLNYINLMDYGRKLSDKDNSNVTNPSVEVVSGGGVKPIEPSPSASGQK